MTKSKSILHREVIDQINRINRAGVASRRNGFACSETLYIIYKHSYGFVTPYYFRYKYDGTITNSYRLSVNKRFMWTMNTSAHWRRIRAERKPGEDICATKMFGRAISRNSPNDLWARAVFDHGVAFNPSTDQLTGHIAPVYG